MNIEKIALQMLTPGKGILAADESTGTMTKRLNDVKVPSTDENRLNFREALFTSGAMKNYIGGVILFDATIREKTSTGVSIPELLEKNNSKYKEEFLDKTTEVLFENKLNNQNKYFGRDKFLNSVIVQSESDLTGKILNIKINAFNHNSLFGKILSNEEQISQLN